MRKPSPELNFEAVAAPGSESYVDDVCTTRLVFPRVGKYQLIDFRVGEPQAVARINFFDPVKGTDVGDADYSGFHLEHLLMGAVGDERKYLKTIEEARSAYETICDEVKMLGRLSGKEGQLYSFDGKAVRGAVTKFHNCVERLVTMGPSPEAAPDARPE